MSASCIAMILLVVVAAISHHNITVCSKGITCPATQHLHPHKSATVPAWWVEPQATYLTVASSPSIDVSSSIALGTLLSVGNVSVTYLANTTTLNGSALTAECNFTVVIHGT